MILESSAIYFKICRERREREIGRERKIREREREWRECSSGGGGGCFKN